MLDKPIDLSIVIPVYNHEKYIKQCLETIMYDLPENTEIIIIDDCSTDNSIEIARKFNSDKIKIYKNEKNMGCAYSLNRAMSIARGTYIGTNNSDDFVEKGFYKKMLEVAKAENADIVCANIADYNDKTQKTIYNDITAGNIFYEVYKHNMKLMENPFEVSASFLLGHWTASSASTKIIKRELFEKYKYIGSKANDLTAIYPIMSEAKKIIYIPNLYMFYRQVPNSLSRRNSEEEYNSVIETIVETMKRLEKIKDSNEKMEILFFNNCLSYFINVLCEIPNVDMKVSTVKYFIYKLKNYRKNIFYDMKKSKYFSIFLKQNGLKEITYDLLEQEAVIDFLINHKLDIFRENNETYIRENCKLNQMIITLENERKRLNVVNDALKLDNMTLKSEIENIKKSTSWKITRPMRRFKLLINNIRRKHS